MDRVATCRAAAREAVADVEPTALYELITDRLESASMTPGVFTLACATALEPEPVSSNGTGAGIDADADGDESGAPSETAASTTARPATTLDPEAIAHHAAGVQLIYEGLRLTRSLSHAEPWMDTTGDSRADLEILAADILVARGFYLLARTDAAETAVRTVRHFGRDQTRRAEPDLDAAAAAALDANLERDVLTLAVETGATAVGASTPPELLTLAEDIAAAADRTFPSAIDCLPELEGVEGVDSLVERTAAPHADSGTAGRRREADLEVDQRPADLPSDRVTSAGDP